MMKDIPPEVSELFKTLRRTIPAEFNPPEVAPVPGPLPGVCFFPGAAGVWGDADKREYVPFPSGGAMIVGQDWGTAQDYKEAGREPWVEPCEATWDNLLSVLKDAGLPPEKCFFTNYFTGLRKTPPSTGEFPGAKDPRYAGLCGGFFLRQIAAARPRLLVLLGLQIPRRVALLSEELKDWRDCGGIKSLDDAGALKENARFGDHSVAAVCWLLHPSMRESNLRYRARKNKTGAAIERELMRDATRKSGILE